MRASKLPQSNDEEKQVRAQALKHAAGLATEVPLSAGRHAVRALELATHAAEDAGMHVISDVLAGSELLYAAIHGLFATLAMNLNSVDDAVRERAITERNVLIVGAQEALMRVRAKVHERTAGHA
jgi:glutamate formiminotransferase/formiminotetrahydrofolate cyclodeaminase